MNNYSSTLISIIIPVYNSGKYLSRCLDSIRGQSFKYFEIICINDASIDNSLSILQSYAHRDSRIHIIDFPKNCGVGEARNAGMAIAKGKYLSFVDSDDSIDEDFYSVLYAEAKKSGADIVQAPIRRVDPRGLKLPQPHWRWFCSSIFQSNFLQSNYINFPSHFTIGEDVIFMERVFLRNPLIQNVKGIYYNYFIISTSASTDITYEKCATLLSAYELAFDEMNQAILDGVSSLTFIQNIFNDFFKSLFFRIMYSFVPDGQKLASEWIINFYSKYNFLKNAFNFENDYESQWFSFVQNAANDKLYKWLRESKKRFSQNVRDKIKYANNKKLS